MILTNRLSDPAVRAFVDAVNAGDRAAFRAALAPGATMSDDGSERDITPWTEKEIFRSDGHMDVESESDDGRHLVVDYRNSTWGHMPTTWQFTVTPEGRISRFETGQA